MSSLGRVLCLLTLAALTGEGAEPRRVIALPPGVTELSEPLVVSGTNVVYRSADPSRPAVLSGGRRLTGWTVDADGVWHLVMPEVKSGKWNFAQLYVNGVRRSRPHVPQIGYRTTVTNAFETATTVGGFAFERGGVYPSWTNREDLELLVLHLWSATRARIDTVDNKANVLTFGAPREKKSFQFDFTKRRYRIENVKEAFGRPGEWYLDRPTGELRYTPMPGETPENCVVVAPRLGTLLKVEGASDVTFEGVRFEHQGYVLPREGYFTVQSAYGLPSAVRVADSRRIVFDRCAIAYTGGYAIEFGERTTNCVVRSSLLHDLGAGGIVIGPFGATPDGRGGHLVENCRITDGGRIFPAGVGVLIGRSSFNRVICNEIDHLYYTGVSCGWDWNSNRPSNAHHNEIAFNHIHNIGQGVLSDMGLVYLLGRAPGTTVHDNNLHDILSGKYGGTGLYPDEGSSELKIYNNLIRNCVRTYHQNFGETNEVFNNVFVNGKSSQYDFRPHVKFQGVTTAFHHNIFVWKTGTLMFRGGPFKEPAEETHPWKPSYETGVETFSNVYFRTGKGELAFGKLTKDEWLRRGRDAGTFFGDPLFAGDVFAGEIALKPESPALKLGFKPFDPGRAGLARPAEVPALARPANPSVKYIQRTMKTLEASTQENPATVRVLFYGQSIMASGYPNLIMEALQKRYPTVRFVWENRAIGGYNSTRLIRTAESDLYPFYPDLVFFHCYGPAKEYGEIVRRIRERTTAEIVLWTSHLNREESKQVSDYLDRPDGRSAAIFAVAAKYHCLAIDLQRKWARMMIERSWTADDLLQDTIHLKKNGPGFAAYADFLSEELIRLPGEDGEPAFSGTITVQRPAAGLRFEFDGNRVVAVMDGTGDLEAEVWLDGKPASSCPELYRNTRPSALVCWMPMIMDVEPAAGVVPQVEDWTLTYLPGTSSDGSNICYRVEGSRTGFDGEGTNTADFRSNSGRVEIRTSDFHTAQYRDFAPRAKHFPKVVAKPGQQVTWSTRPLFADPYKSGAKGERIVLVQNCSNGPHVLELRPMKGGRSGIADLEISKPAAFGPKMLYSRSDPDVIAGSVKGRQDEESDGVYCEPLPHADSPELPVKSSK